MTNELEDPKSQRRLTLGNIFWAIAVVSFGIFILLMVVSPRLCLVFFASLGAAYGIYFMRHGVFPLRGFRIYSDDHPILFWFSGASWLLLMAAVASAAFLT